LSGRFAFPRPGPCADCLTARLDVARGNKGPADGGTLSSSVEKCNTSFSSPFVVLVFRSHFRSSQTVGHWEFRTRSKNAISRGRSAGEEKVGLGWLWAWVFAVGGVFEFLTPFWSTQKRMRVQSSSASAGQASWACRSHFAFRCASASVDGDMYIRELHSIRLLGPISRGDLDGIPRGRENGEMECGDKLPLLVRWDRA
jgi:hypothetical protein